MLWQRLSASIECVGPFSRGLLFTHARRVCCAAQPSSASSATGQSLQNGRLLVTRALGILQPRMSLRDNRHLRHSPLQLKHASPNSFRNSIPGGSLCWHETSQGAGRQGAKETEITGGLTAPPSQGVHRASVHWQASAQKDSSCMPGPASQSNWALEGQAALEGCRAMPGR